MPRSSGSAPFRGRRTGRAFRIAPTYLEFWKDGAFRLHDRVVFRRAAAGGDWTKQQRLYP